VASLVQQQLRDAHSLIVVLVSHQQAMHSSSMRLQDTCSHGCMYQLCAHRRIVQGNEQGVCAWVKKQL
jgi:hypothetical protein